MRKRIYDSTSGYAFHVAGIVSFWREQGDQPFTHADIPLIEGKLNENALSKEVSMRILGESLISPYRELVHYGGTITSL